jgi:outer membrane protein TolC
MMPLKFIIRSAVALATLMLSANFAQSQQRLFETFPEQRALSVRSPEELPSVPVPPVGVPFTVSIDSDNRIPEQISLDEAIQIAVRNAEVIRVLTGVSAANSGSTIYDVAITNTGIDFATSVFDPRFRLSSIWDGNPTRTDLVNTSVGVSKQTLNGATVGVNAGGIGSYFEPPGAPLNPQYNSFAELTLTQPLLQGYGRAANLAPVVVARIDTERSYFRFKDSVQELVRGVIAAYWNLVAARVDVWARQQQVEQAEFAVDRAVARQVKGLSRIADVAQARSALANFRAGLITARATLILAETALRNILGLDPSDTSVFVPTSIPVLEQVEFDWNEIVAMAELYRPDVIELKLILEADRQNLVVADNQAKPQLDGIANYRWDGLSGELPSGVVVSDPTGSLRGFTLGVNFSVPLGLRRDRASLRRQELIIARDQANLTQGIFQMVQQLTINYRNLDQFFDQYIAFKEARIAARLNYENQAAEVLAGRREFINALQAITDWGNAVSQEARSITQYNTELANVERQSGTILETHGVYFVEERFGSLGPRLFGLLRSDECYPERLNLDGVTDRYQESESSSDDSFNLEELNPRRESDGQEGEMDTPPEAPTPKLEIPPPALPDINTSRSGLPTLKAIIGSEKVARQRDRLSDLFR